MKMLKRNGLRMEPTGTLLGTGHNADVNPFHYNNPLWPTGEPVAYPSQDVFILMRAGHFVQKDPLRNTTKSLSEVQNDYIKWLCNMN